MTALTIRRAFVLAAAALACPAAASKPCRGFEPEMAFSRPKAVVHVPRNARLLCTTEMRDELFEPVVLGKIQFDLKRECDGEVCECVMPASATVAGRIYLLRDASGRPLAAFKGVEGLAGVECRSGDGNLGGATLEQVQLAAAVKLRAWNETPPGTCYLVPEGTRLVGKLYLWPSDGEGFQVVEVGPPLGGGKPSRPDLAARPTHFFGACPPHVALEFVPRRSGEPALLYRWEVHSLGGSRLEGPFFGNVLRVHTMEDRSPLRAGGSYALIVTAIDSLRRESEPATLRFTLPHTGGKERRAPAPSP